MPKAELHCHLYGAIPPATLVEIAGRNGIPLGTNDPDHVYDFDSLESFFVLSEKISASLRTADDLSTATYASLVEAADRGNLRYREMFFGPNHLDRIPYPEALRGILDGARAAHVDRGVVCYLIPVIARSLGPGPARELVELVIEHRRDEVLGIGLAGHEDSAGPELFVDAFHRAREAGLHRTAHAGETGSSENVRVAIEVLNCERIDHGYGIVNDADLLSLARDRGTHFTGCWWASSQLLGGGAGRDNPIGRMIRSGLDVSINTDDPAIYGTDLAREYTGAADSLQLSRDDMERVCLSAIDASWLDEDARRTLRRSFTDEFRTL